MSSSQKPLIHCLEMNVSGALINGTAAPSQSDQVFYKCEYLPLSERTLQLFRQPHSAIAVVFGLLGIVINILCLLAVHFQMRGRFTTHFRFIVSLALSDVLIALSVVLHFTNHVLNPPLYPGFGPRDVRLRSRCAFVLIKALNTTALNISLLNLTGMALDHYVAILMPLHGARLLSKRRSTLLILIFWAVAVACGYSDLLSVIPDRKYLGRYNFCELAFLTPYQEEYTVFATALMCLVCMLFFYVRIYVKIHERRRRAGGMQEDQRIHAAASMKQTKKALVTTLMILGTFMVCWLPLCLFQVALIIQVKVNAEALQPVIEYLHIADQYLYDLTLLNSILDPVIYAIRMPEVRCGYRKMFWYLSRCCRRDGAFDIFHSGTYMSMLEKNSSFRLSNRIARSRNGSVRTYLDTERRAEKKNLEG